MRASQSLLALVGAILFSGALAAQPLLVTTTADDFDGVCDSHCSLRDAIVQANNAGSLMQIELPAGEYRLTRASAPDANGYPLDEDMGHSGDLDIRGQVLIRGAGRDSTRILGTVNSRLIQVHPQAWFGLYGVHLEGGDSIADGGALHNRGEALLKSVYLVKNQVMVPAGYGVDGSGAPTAGVGGAIANFGTLHLYDALLVGNLLDAADHPVTEGSALFNAGQLVVRDSAFVGNASARMYQDFGGAAVVNSGTADIARSWFSHNSSGEDGQVSLFNGGSLKLSNSTLFALEGLMNQRDSDQGPTPDATLIHVTSVGGVINRARMRVRNSLFAGSPYYFDQEYPDDCHSGGAEASFEAIGLVTSSPEGCPAGAYEEFAEVFNRLLHPRNEGNAASHPRGSLTWALALGRYGSHLQPRAGGLAIDASIGSCAGHDQLRAPRPQDGTGDGVAICDLGAIEISAVPPVQP